jgi:CO/xanthine dehydrogenase FAD-binding subunit
VDELAELSSDEAGALHAGALVTHATLASSPLVGERWTALADASAIVGSPATRHVATLGGNLANASPAMEVGAPLAVFEASVELASARGVRTLPLGEYLVGPGRTAASADELVTWVHVPPPPAVSGSAYLRLEYRRAMEIAVVGAAALVSLGADGVVADVRLALTAVAPTIVRARDAEESLRGRGPTGEALREAAREVGAAAAPIGDVRASAGYRAAMVEVIARRALEVAVARASGEQVAVPASRHHQERSST